MYHFRADDDSQCAQNTSGMKTTLTRYKPVLWNVYLFYGKTRYFYNRLFIEWCIYMAVHNRMSNGSDKHNLITHFHDVLSGVNSTLLKTSASTKVRS